MFDKNPTLSPLAPHAHPKHVHSYNMAASKNKDFEGTFRRRSSHEGISKK